MRYLIPTVITYANAYTGDVRLSFASLRGVNGADAQCGIDWIDGGMAQKAIQVSNNHRDYNKHIRRT